MESNLVNKFVAYTSIFDPLRLLLLLVTQSSWLFANPWTVAFQVPLFLELSRQEYWTWLPCPPSGYFPDLGIKPTSPA